MLPTTQEYKISIMIGEDSFRTLKDIEIISNPNYPNEPWYSTGGLAIVFKIKMKEKFYALKCFYAEANERQERLGHIVTYLKQNTSPYFVDFTYLDNELWVETTQGGNGYPVVLMEWVEGKTLDNYLAEVCKIQDKARLQNLYFQFCNLAWWLQQQPIAHGDLKHDNLIVTPEGKLKLIDYDGMFVPALSSRKASELGSPCYQHPKRDTHFFNKDLDDFSLLILQITLLALQHEPTLFAKHYNGDGILLKDTDYSNFAQSTIRALLWQLPDVKLPLLLSQLQSNLKQPQAIDLVPLLQDVEWINWLVGGQKDSNLATERQIIENLVGGLKDSNLATERQHLKELVLEGIRWKDLLTALLSKHHPLSENLLKKYKDKWDWHCLGSNTGLPWSIDLIDKYKGWYGWGNLSENTGLSWTRELIEKYEDRWDWYCLSGNIGLPWSIDLIDKYYFEWNWDALSSNKGLPWSIDLIAEYYHKWAWDALSSNKYLPWSIDLIEIFKDKWYWEDLSSNIGLPWTIDLIETYKNKWNWGCLSSNEGLPWTIYLIKIYKDKWYWYFMSRNKGLPWTIELMKIYKNSWIIEGFSCNSNLPWTIDLITKHENGWDWQELSSNEGLPWTIDLITKYEDRWDWEVLSSNEGLPWTIELLEKYKDKWSWGFLADNSYLYKKVFQPLLNDEFIDEIMSGK